VFFFFFSGTRQFIGVLFSLEDVQKDKKEFFGVFTDMCKRIPNDLIDGISC